MRDKSLKPTTDSGELLKRIDNFLAEEHENETQAIEDLRQALIEDGSDPDAMLDRIRARLAPLFVFKKKKA